MFEYICISGQSILSGTTVSIFTTRLWQHLSRLNVICTNVAGRGTTCDVTSWVECISVRRMEMVTLVVNVGHSSDDRARNSYTVLAVLRVIVK